MSTYIAQGMMDLVHHASLPPWRAHLLYLIIRNDRCCKPLSLEMFHTLANFSSFSIPVCAEIHTVGWGGPAQGRVSVGIKPATSRQPSLTNLFVFQLSGLIRIKTKEKDIHSDFYVALSYIQTISSLPFLYFCSLHCLEGCILPLVQYV